MILRHAKGQCGAGSGADVSDGQHGFVQRINLERFLLGKGKFKKKKRSAKKLPTPPLGFSRTFREFLRLHLNASVPGLR